MGFNSVFQSLTELFPQIDSRILRTVANEHPADADEAAAVVISEVVPLLSQNWAYDFNQPENKKFKAPLDCKVEEDDVQNEDGSLSLSQWLQPSMLPQSYLAFLNDESTPDENEKPPLDYVVKEVVLPSRDAPTGPGLGGGIRTLYSASENGGTCSDKTASSMVKPSIRVQSRTSNDLSGSSSKAPVAGRSPRKSTHPWSQNYSEKLRSWKKRCNSNNNRDNDESKDVPSKKFYKDKNKCYNTERNRKQRIGDNIKALAELLPHEVEEDTSESILNDIVDHVKLLQLQMKELSRSRLVGEPITHPMTFVEGYGHYIQHEEAMTKPLEEMMEDLLANDPDAATSLLESKGLYLMPLSSAQGFC
ncbi:unnamed protein product [Thlaspi arvense]|uniref:BHLH domain-containing protein n=1 Tax=Thlaspi arvense TaxID=13288 RepID=A0AAU9RMZ0_THLAR|nr:unnamed protein product [Thlaspi arvense]